MKHMSRKEIFMYAMAKGEHPPIVPLTREEILMTKHAEREANGGSGGASSWNDLEDKPFYKEKQVALTLNESDFAVENFDGEVVISTNLDFLNWFDNEDTIDFEVTIYDAASGKTVAYTKENNGCYVGRFESVTFLQFGVGDHFEFFLGNGERFERVEEEWGATYTTFPDNTKANIFMRHGEDIDLVVKRVVLYKVDQKRLPTWAMPKTFATTVIDIEAAGLPHWSNYYSTEGEFSECMVEEVQQYFEIAKWAEHNGAIFYDFRNNARVSAYFEMIDVDGCSFECLFVSFLHDYILPLSNGTCEVQRTRLFKEFYIDGEGNAWQRCSVTTTKCGKTSN